MRLTHHFREISGPVFAGKDEIGHGPILWPAAAAPGPMPSQPARQTGNNGHRVTRTIS